MRKTTEPDAPAADTPPTADTAPEQPSEGGSYVRQADGSLKRQKD